MLQQHTFHRHAPRGGHRRFKALTGHLPVCPARQAPPALTPEKAEQLSAAEQAAYDAHQRARATWEANRDPQTSAALDTAYKDWQAARQACLRARAVRPDLVPQLRA